VRGRDVKCTLGNLGTGDVQLSVKDMKEIAPLLEKYQRIGFVRHHKFPSLVALATVICLPVLCYDASMFEARK